MQDVLLQQAEEGFHRGVVAARWPGPGVRNEQDHESLRETVRPLSCGIHLRAVE